MSADILTALIAAAVAIGGSWVVAIQAGRTGAQRQVQRLEDRVTALERENRHLWLWARSLVDYAYSYRTPGSPELPPMPDALRNS